MDLWNREHKAGIKLYVKRVFIMDEAESLMPSYLRWVKGVVDSADLPLNVSRELLQESRDVKAIREGNTRRVLALLEDLAKKDKAPVAADGADGVTDVVSAEDKAAAEKDVGKYATFYAEFGAVLKEGLGEDFANRDKKAGIKLYVKRVFIMDEAEALMPSYLRWVKGVVDSADLPLNVSRELLQESRDVKAIREGNTRRVLGMLEDLARKDKLPATEGAESADGVTDVLSAEEKAEAEKDVGKYSAFYAEFGGVLKEGLGEDFANKDKIAKLLRFASSTTDGVHTGFADYKARMKEGQEAIYYITADNAAAAKNSPQLEVFKKKGIEVLLMTDRVDEWALSFVHEFDGTPLQSVAKGAVDLGTLQDEEEKKAAEVAAEGFKPLLEKLKASLKDKAQDVRVTTRLVDSPACLVVQDDGMSTQLARMLKQAGQQAPESKPVLEVNAEHALVKKLEGSVHFNDLAHILFDQALLAEGGLPDDPAAYVKRVNALLV